jgi:hypothetical protein
MPPQFLIPTSLMPEGGGATGYPLDSRAQRAQAPDVTAKGRIMPSTELHPGCPPFDSHFTCYTMSLNEPARLSNKLSISVVVHKATQQE